MLYTYQAECRVSYIGLDIFVPNYHIVCRLFSHNNKLLVASLCEILLSSLQIEGDAQVELQLSVKKRNRWFDFSARLCLLDLASEYAWTHFFYLFSYRLIEG